MRILLVSPLPPPTGGIATWTVEYLKEGNQKNRDIELVNTALITKNQEAIVNKRILTNEVKRTFKILSEMRMKIRWYQPDIVHINTSCSKMGMIRDLVCVQIAKKAKIKVLLHCHCNVSDMIGDAFVSKNIFKLIAKKSDYVLGLNKRSLVYIKEVVGDERCKLIPNFATTNKSKKKLNTNDKVETCIFVGHVRKEKGIFEIVEVAKMLPNVNFKLLGPVADDVKKIALPKNIILFGTLDHELVMEHLKEADLFLFPSYSEGFSLAMLEAMSIGLPIIATDVGANKDMIEDKGGIIVNTGDVKSLYVAINELGDSSIRKSMSNWNIEKVKNNYTTEVVLSKIQSIYCDLISN